MKILILFQVADFLKISIVYSLNKHLFVLQREKETKSPVTENPTEQTNVTSEKSDEKRKEENEETTDKNEKNKKKKKKKERTDKKKKKQEDQSGSSSKLDSFCHSDEVSQNAKKDVSAETVQTSVVKPQVIYIYINIDYIIL